MATYAIGDVQGCFDELQALLGRVAFSSSDRLWFVDSETSALRYIAEGELHTVAGQGLFDFGLVDGDREQALMQHPLGVAVLPDGAVAVADTYNGAIHRYDPVTGRLTTMATGLAEPSDLVVAGDTVYVVESAAHRVSALAPGSVPATEPNGRSPTSRWVR